MIKKILFILSIIYCSSIYSQYEWTPAKIILKNGKSIRGLVKFPKHSGGLISIGSTEFKYKKKKKSKTSQYGHKVIEKIIFGDEEFTTVEYKYVPIKRNKYVLLQLVVNGNVSLYSRTVLKFQRSYHVFDSNNTIGTPGNYYDDTQFYLLRDNEQKATLIKGPNSFGGFILKAKKYFSDCKDIVYYLDSDVYDKNNLIELVEDYNLLCE